MINYDKVFSKFPELETKHLKLRAFSKFDFLTYYNICQDPDFMREFIPNDLEVSPMDALNTITQKYTQSFLSKQDITWAIILKGSRERIIGLRDIFIDSPTAPVVTQGFISKEYRNCGYNQEILYAVIDFLKSADAETLVYNCSEDNDVVIHIAEKLGFKDISTFQIRMRRFNTRRIFQLKLL